MAIVARKSDRVWVPWKNGAGVITDIAMSPDRTPSGDPDWRVSMAKVERDSPFSHFEGVERGMMLVEGERLDLHVADDPPLTVRASGPAVTFAGDRPTRGVPVGKPILNLNVMVQRDVLRHRMIRWALQGRAWLPVADRAQTFLFVQQGHITSSGGIACAAGDVLSLNAPQEISGAAELIEVNIWPATV